MNNHRTRPKKGIYASEVNPYSTGGHLVIVNLERTPCEECGCPKSWYNPGWRCWHHSSTAADLFANLPTRVSVKHKYQEYSPAAPLFRPWIDPPYTPCEDIKMSDEDLADESTYAEQAGIPVPPA